MKLAQTRYLSLITLFLTLLFQVGISWAQGAPGVPLTLNTDPSDTDASIKLLYKIIGDPFSDDLHPVTGNAFLVLNSGIMLLATVMFMYTSIVGILRSAPNGEFLGQNWSSIWIPLRFSLGIALIFPTVNGFSMIQKGTVWLGEQGIGYANLLLTSSVRGLVDNQGSIIALRLADTGSIQTMMKEILRSEACVADLKSKYPDINFGIRKIDREGGGGRIVWGATQDSSSYSEFSSFTTTFPVDVCGSITIPSVYTTSNANNPVTVAGGMVADLMKSAVVGINTATRQIQTSQYLALENAILYLRPYAVAIGSIDGTKPTAKALTDAVDEATKRYLDLVENASRASVIEKNKVLTDAFVRDIEQTGWVGFGAWYYQMARINTELNKMSSLVPEVTGATIASSSGLDGLSPELSAMIDGAIAAERSRRPEVPNYRGVIKSAGSNNEGLFGAFDGAIGSGFENGTNAAVGWGAQNTAELFGVDPHSDTNALIQLKNVGDVLLNTVQSIAVIGAVSEFLPAGKISNAAAALPGFSTLKDWVNGDRNKGVFDFLKMLGFFALMALIGFAVVLAFWLPISPFIIWMGSVLGWLISFVEMIVAAPIWIGAHMHPEGEGIAGQYGATGYMLLAEIFCRPFLMVIGMIFSMLLIDPFLKFTSAIFFNAMATVTADGLAGLATFLATVFIYVGFNVGLVQRCFAVIHIFPNSVLRWVGAHASGHDQGDQSDREIHAAVLGYLRGGEATAQRATATSREMKDKRNKAKQDKSQTDQVRQRSDDNLR